MPLQKEGVILAAVGAAVFIKSMKDASKAYGGFIDKISKRVSTSKIGGLLHLGNAAKLAGGALKLAGKGALVATAAIGGTAVGIGILGKQMANLAKETAPLLGIQAQFISQTQEMAGGMQGMLSALQRGASGMISNRQLMMSFNQAASLVNLQFAEKLPQALGLLGKVSLATGADMNFLLDSLVRGVGRVSPLVLDNLFIQLGVAEATDAASKEFEKEASALSKTEQQTALMNIALEKLEAKFGALPDVADSAVGQMGQLGANFQNIKDTLGQFLLPAWTTFLKAVNALAGAFGEAIAEGGVLYPLLVDFGAVLSLAADAALGFAQNVMSWINAFNFAGEGAQTMVDQMGQDMAELTGLAEQATQDVSKTFWEWVTEATQWGAELVAGFATGIIDAANTVLVEAMRYIEQILAYWLAPGSPPRVAPGLEAWGIGAFESFLKGMTEADFGILENIQGPLKKILTGPEFADISKAIAGALSGGDRAGALEILAKSSKQFGDDIAELARREFALADAVAAVEDAELRLAEAQERAIKSQRQVGIETQKYNELLRSGASEEALQAQLARINAAEDEASAARKEASAAETGIEAAKSKVDILKEQVDWQKRFLEQLFGINDALTEEEKRERAVKGAKGKGVPTPEAPAMGGFAAGIGGAIGAAIEAAKGKIKAALAGLWGIIKTEFKDKWDAAIKGLGTTWEEFKTTVGQAWDTLKEKFPFLEAVELWIVNLPEKIRTLIDTGWNVLLGAVTSVYNFLNDYIVPILKDLAQIWLFGVQFASYQFARFWEITLLPMLTAVWKFIDEPLRKALDWLGEKLLWLKDSVLKLVSDAVYWLKEQLISLHTWLQNVIEAMKKLPSSWIPHSTPPIAKGFLETADALKYLSEVEMRRFRMGQMMSLQPAVASARFYRPPGSVYNNQRTANNTFNTTVSNGMDAAALTAMIRRVIRQELQ